MGKAQETEAIAFITLIAVPKKVSEVRFPGGKGGMGLLFAERQMLQGWEAPGKALCSLRLLHVTVKFKVRQPSNAWD